MWLAHRLRRRRGPTDAEMRRALDAIWRRSGLPFDDRDRFMIQNIALAYLHGGPKPGSEVARWMEDTNAER